MHGKFILAMHDIFECPWSLLKSVTSRSLGHLWNEQIYYVTATYAVEGMKSPWFFDVRVGIKK